VTTIALMVVGNLVVYAIGASWPAADLHLSAVKGLASGVGLFHITDAVKVALAAVVFPSAWRFARR
jgi:biotin transport system substrate-specific component